MADNINNFFYVFKVRGTALSNNPVLVAKEVVSSLVKGYCIFIGIHDYSGYKLVNGYIYDNKKAGVVNISFIDGSSYRVDIVNGEYILR